MVENTLLKILIVALIAGLIMCSVDLYFIATALEKPKIVAKHTWNFTMPPNGTWQSDGSHGYREAAQAKTPSLSDCFTAALTHKGS